MTTLDRRDPLPLYVQLEQALLRDIRDRGQVPGDRLATEAEIAQTFGVSRQTARQSLARLVADGHVERVQGLGSFVAKPRPKHQSLLTSFTENMHAQDYLPQRRLMRSGVVDCPPDLQDEPSGGTSECQYIQRLLLADKRPIAVSETWLPVECLAGRLDLFTADILEQSSLYELLQGPEVGLRLDRGVETVRAGLTTEEQSKQLECPANSPALIVRRVSYTPSDRPVEWTVMTFAADRYEYRVELARPKDQPAQP